MLFVAIPHQTDLDFGRFWDAYPKKVGKFDARRAWGKVYRSTTLTEILTALAWQRTSRQWKAGYIPNPSTYLNQGRWLDQPPEDLSQPAPSGNTWACICDQLETSGQVTRLYRFRFLSPCQVVQDSPQTLIVAVEESALPWVRKYYQAALEAILAQQQPGCRLVLEMQKART